MKQKHQYLFEDANAENETAEAIKQLIVRNVVDEIKSKNKESN